MKRPSVTAGERALEGDLKRGLFPHRAFDGEGVGFSLPGGEEGIGAREWLGGEEVRW